MEGKKDTNDVTLWNVLDFHNLTGLNVLRLHSCEFLPLRYIQMLSSLRTLVISCSSNTFPFVEADCHVNHQFPVQWLTISKWSASGKDLTQLLTYFPKLSDLRLWRCGKVTGLAVNVMRQHATDTPGPSSSANKVEQQQNRRAKEDVIVVSEEAEQGLSLLPPQLQDLWIHHCPKLSLHSNPWALQALTSLRRLSIMNCPKLLASYLSSSFSSSFPFPNSLEHLAIYRAVGMDTLVPISNLTSLTRLSIWARGHLRGQGLVSLLAQGHLTELSVRGTPNFFVDSERPQVHEQETPSCSSKLQELETDDVAGFSAMLIRRNLLLSSLNKFEIAGDNKVQRFTEQQEVLLFVNSLEDITFSLCHNLHSLPRRLHRLPNLKRLRIWSCEAIEMLSKDDLPSSLEELHITSCPEIQSLPKDCLPDSLQKLVIERCPAIRSLPEVYDLPTSLREINVSESKSEELRRQCCKLKDIIPIVRA